MPMVGDAVRHCLGVGTDSESGIKYISTIHRAMVKGSTFDFNHLHIMAASCFMSTVALALTYGAGAGDIVGPTRQGSQ